jgi:hypothetical protein
VAISRLGQHESPAPLRLETYRHEMSFITSMPNNINMPPCRRGTRNKLHAASPNDHRGSLRPDQGLPRTGPVDKHLAADAQVRTADRDLEFNAT